jgi:hypothetical protein
VAADVDSTRLHVTLADGRELYVPIDWFGWLVTADEAQRSDFDIIEGGQGIWWNSIDEGVSVPGLFGLSHY